MKLSPLQKRAERRQRNQSMVDLNLVSLIDVFTILIFFLLSSASSEVEVLPSAQEVRLPESTADRSPRETVVVVVNGSDIVVDGRKVAAVSQVLAMPGDVIEPLRSELQAQAQRRPAGGENPDRKRALTIMGDKDIPYRLLRKIMVTGARADYGDVAFAVLRKYEP